MRKVKGVLLATAFCGCTMTAGAALAGTIAVAPPHESGLAHAEAANKTTTSNKDKETKKDDGFIRRHLKGTYVRMNLTHMYYNNDVTTSAFSKKPKSSRVYEYGVGYSFANYPLRMEFSMHNDKFNAKQDDSSLTAKTRMYMFNLYRDFPLDKTNKILNRLVPYVGLGFGQIEYGSVKYTTPYGSYNSPIPMPPLTIDMKPTTKSILAAILGTRIRMDMMFLLDFGYKFTNLGEINSNARPNKLRGHSAFISLIFNAGELLTS